MSTPLMKIDSPYIYVDFYENLSVHTKYELHSFHWVHEQVSVHSGILKNILKAYIW